MLDDISSSRRTVTAGCLRQISCAIQFLFDFEFLFLRSLLHSGPCEGCFRGVYQNPPEGTGVTFAEIADVFATCLAVPYTAVYGTRAKAEGTQLGRPAEIAGDAAKVKAIRAARAAGKSFREVAREFGVGVGTVQRLTA